MISRDTLHEFNKELLKLSSASAGKKAMDLTKVKALGLLGLGAGAGVVGEQAKDDLMSGRRARKQQAQAMGVRPFTL